MYPKKVKRIIVWNKWVIKQYLIFISPKILAHARARVDGLACTNYLGAPLLLSHQLFWYPLTY